MEALLALAGGDGSNNVADLLDRMLLMERRHWTRIIDGLAGDEDRQEALRRGISQVTLVGGAPNRRSAEDLLIGDSYFGRRAPAHVPARELQRLYGIASGVTGLEPDLLGEHEALLSSDDRLLEACLSWIESLPETEHAPRRRALITVLQRATRPEHGPRVAAAEEMLAYLIPILPPEGMADLVAVVVETPGRLADVLKNAVPNLDETKLSALQAALPQSSVNLMEVADAVAARQVDLSRRLAAEDTTSEDHLFELLKALRYRGMTLSRLGLDEEALAATQEAVDIGRRLATTDSDAYDAVLANSLSNLSTMLATLGRHTEGLAAGEEAVAILRHLAAFDPDVYDPDLARVLYNLGKPLTFLGRHTEAVAADEEAVAIYRRLTAADQDAYDPSLAQILGTLGAELSVLGRQAEAIEAGREAVAIHRRLAAANPDAFDPGLATSLVQFGIALDKSGRQQEALEPSNEAVAIFRRTRRYTSD